MKFRTDFVTNSSSSSYITFVFETKDKRKYTCVSDEDDAGLFGGGVVLDEFTLEKAINAENGKEVLEVISEAYDDLVRSANLDDGIFEHVEERESTIDKAALKALPAGEIKKVTINEDVRTDEGSSRGKLILDLQKKTEQVEYIMDYDGEIQTHKELRNLKTEATDVQDDYFDNIFDSAIDLVPYEQFVEMYQIDPDTFDEDEYMTFLHNLVFDFGHKKGGPFNIDFDDFMFRLENGSDCESDLSRREYKNVRKEIVSMFSEEEE